MWARVYYNVIVCQICVLLSVDMHLIDFPLSLLNTVCCSGLVIIVYIDVNKLDNPRTTYFLLRLTLVFCCGDWSEQ